MNEEPVENAAAPQEKTPKDWHKYIQGEMTAANTRLKNYLKIGNGVVNRYKDERTSAEVSKKSPTQRLNLFYQNVSTKEAMLYGKKPKIDVSREHKDPDDDDARVAAYLYERILDAYCEDPTPLRSALQDRLLPGQGVMRVRYENTVQDVQNIDGTMTQAIVDERAPAEFVHWQDFRWGWCRCWDECPWIAFRVWMPKEDVRTRFGDRVAENLQYKVKSPTGVDESDDTADEDEKSNTMEAEIWEFWHKRERKVFWFSEGADQTLDIKDDPLQLRHFWPIPRPMTANTTTSLFEPTADFRLAEDLYNEIDILQERISHITEAVKVVGVYDKAAGNSVGRMLKEGNENELIPVDNWAMFAESGGLKGAVDWFDTMTAVQVLQVLDQVQKSKIQQLHEVTGLSDLLRGGNTDQYTSDGTNRMKAKFGSIKIQQLQDDFARFASELEQLRCEVISRHFTPESIVRQSNALFIPEADKPRLQAALALMKSKDVYWRIDIAPESIAMTDYAQLQSERVQYLTAMSTFMQSGQAVMKQVPGALPLLLEFMKFGLAGFKGADALEGILDQAIEAALKNPPKGEGDDGKAQAEMQKAQMDHQFKMQEMQVKMQGDMQQEAVKHQNAMQQEMADQRNKVQLEQIGHQNTMREMMVEFQNDMKKLVEDLAADLQREEMQSAMAMAEDSARHQQTMTEKRADAKVATDSRPGNGEE